ALAIDLKPLSLQHRGHSPRAQERPGGEQLVDPPHQGKVVVVGRPSRPVDPRARDAKQHALPADRQRLVGAIEHSSTVRRAHLPDLRAKKSRSTVSCPILACSFSISRSRVSSLSRPTPASKARAACSRSCFSGSGAPHSAAPDRPPSPAPAPPPAQSLPSTPRQSSVSSSSSS